MKPRASLLDLPRMAIASVHAIPISAFLVTAAPRPVVAKDYFPPPETAGGWRSLATLNATPLTSQEKATLRANTGFDWDKLLEAWAYSSSFGTRNSVVVIRHGWIAGEWRNYEQALGVASSTKSITGLTMAKLFDASDRGQTKKKVGIDDFV